MNTAKVKAETRRCLKCLPLDMDEPGVGVVIGKDTLYVFQTGDNLAAEAARNEWKVGEAVEPTFRITTGGDKAMQKEVEKNVVELLGRHGDPRFRISGGR